MYIRNATSTSTDDAEDKQKKAEIESKKRRIQMEILIMEGDLRKINTDKISVDNDIRKLTRDAERIRINLDEKKRHLAKLMQDTRTTEDELRTLRKKLNLL
jgi:uncharacterized protein (DUF3084 family)